MLIISSQLKCFPQTKLYLVAKKFRGMVLIHNSICCLSFGKLEQLFFAHFMKVYFIGKILKFSRIPTKRPIISLFQRKFTNIDITNTVHGTFFLHMNDQNEHENAVLRGTYLGRKNKCIHPCSVAALHDAWTRGFRRPCFHTVTHFEDFENVNCV